MWTKIENKKPQLLILQVIAVFISGEDGARTHDLLTASQAL